MIRHLSVCLLLAAAFLAMCPAAYATDFAVLLGGNGGGDLSQPLSIKNPLYEEGSQSGENPLYEPSALVLWPSQFVGQTQVLLEVNFGGSIGGSLPPSPGDGYPFEINLSDAATGEPITQFATPIDLGLIIPALAHLHREGIVHRDLAMRTFDTSLTPPAWRLQDDKLMTCDGDKFCGKTDHLSAFSFGAIPEPSCIVIAALGTMAALQRRRP